MPIHIGNLSTGIKAFVVTVGLTFSSSTYLPLVYLSFATVLFITYRPLSVLLSCVFVLVKLLVTIFIYFVSCFICIRTPVSIKKEFKKSEKKKSRKKDRKIQKKSKRRGKGLYCGLHTENSVYTFRFLMIYIPAILYLLSTSNHLIFSTVASLV